MHWGKGRGFAHLLILTVPLCGDMCAQWTLLMGDLLEDIVHHKPVVVCSNQEGDPMLIKLSMTPAVVLMAFLVSGCVGMTGGSDQLMKMVASQLGVTNNQAMGGVGSELALAKEEMGSMDFNALTKAIPGSDTYMKAAKDLGAVTGPVGDKAGYSPPSSAWVCSLGW